jgi:hypothetical protein
VSRLTSVLLAISATAGAMVVVARLSALPIASHDGGSARLRLSWSARPERIEICRSVSAEEQARREEHMRQRVECDGKFATYVLRVEADGRIVEDRIVRGSGLRHDRPMYVLRDFVVPSGARRMRIDLERRERVSESATAAAVSPATGADTGIFAGRAERERVERARRARAAIPERLTLDTTITFPAGGVVIVTIDPERRALVVLSAR